MDEIDPQTLDDRILAQSDDNPTIHAVIKAGEDDEREYHVVVATKFHEGTEMLKIRYFAADHTTPRKDTWMQNGITARRTGDLAGRLGEVLDAVDGTLPDDVTITHDATTGE